MKSTRCLDREPAKMKSYAVFSTLATAGAQLLVGVSFVARRSRRRKFRPMPLLQWRDSAGCPTRSCRALSLSGCAAGMMASGSNLTGGEYMLQKVMVSGMLLQLGPHQPLSVGLCFLLGF